MQIKFFYGFQGISYMKPSPANAHRTKLFSFTEMLTNHSNIPNMHVCTPILFPFQRPQPTIYTMYRTVIYLIFPKHEIFSIYLVLAN